MTPELTRNIELFYSYSHKDEALRDRLETHLVSLKRQGLISMWHDRKIVAGKEWGGTIDTHLETAQIILLLISADFIASDYCYGIEMKRAIERHQRGDTHVIPVILHPVDGWKEVSLETFRLGNLQALPKDGKPVTTWSNREAAFQNIAEGIRIAVRELLKPMLPSQIEQRYVNRELVKYAVRLVPKQVFREDGLLGIEERKYVFVGDYAEQRGRSLRQILSNLWMGDAFDQVSSANLEWVAIMFEVGEQNWRKLDLMPATWKAIFRILSDSKRLNSIVASEEERLRMGYPPRDYYSDDQGYWYGCLTEPERRYSGPYPDFLIKGYFGLQWLCFSGMGKTENRENPSTIPSRVFYVKNVPISDTNHWIQELGSTNSENILQ